MAEYKNYDELEGVAIIGMAGRFPGADNIEELWKNLCNGEESIRFFKDEELDPSIDPSLTSKINYIKARGIINDIEYFDAEFFKCYPREAQIMDPQTRIFLEIAWESLEKAGYIPGVPERKIGLFAGKGYNSYYANNIFGREDVNETFGAFEAQLLNEKDFFSTQVSYKLNLTGPSINVNTGCSTSLVAVCLAFDSLLNYQCDIALAGGITIHSPQNAGYLYEEGKITSSDGHCRPFDINASGTVFGNGVGIIVMKRLSEAIEDGDLIYAVIKGCGLNNDGSNKMSFTAPSVDGQAEAIIMAQANAGVNPETISYIETHGTATALGDPVEIEALTQAFRTQTDKRQFCAIGSIKGNIGHLDSAAGIAGVIKTALALYHKKLPPSINFREPNPKIDFHNSPFFVNTKLSEWASNEFPRRAGISSLGIGGTNAHIILEEAPLTESSSDSRPWHLIMLSAKKETTLENMTRQLAKYVESNSDTNLADMAFTLQTGRQEMSSRRYLVCRDMVDAIKKLNSPDLSNISNQKTEINNHPIAFMFPGQGSQYVNMGLNLYRHEPEFQEVVDYCTETLIPFLGTDLRDILYPKSGGEKEAGEMLKKTFFQQPAMFTIEYALAKLWMQWGIKPAAMIGHSIGEYVAACLADVFSIKDALMLVANRGRMMQDLPGGSMLSVRLPAKEIESKLSPGLSLAAVNAPSLCVVSGSSDSIGEFQKRLESEEIMCRLLYTSHAFHSPMMEKIVEPFSEIVKSVNPSSPKTPFISTVTGEWITPQQASDPMYWGRQLRVAVRFADGIQTLWEASDYVLLEVGPRTTATTLARQQIKDRAKQKAIATLGDTSEQEGEWKAIMTAISDLWLSGVQIDWDAFYKNEQRHRLPLPTYPFERKRFWLEPIRAFYRSAASDTSCEKVIAKVDIKYNAIEETENVDHETISIPDIKHSKAEMLVAEVWHKVLGVDKEDTYNAYFRDLGGDSLSVLKVIALIHKKTGVFLTPFTIMLNTIEKIAPYLEQESSLLEPETEVGDGEKQKVLVKQTTIESNDIVPFYFGDPQKRLCGIYHPPSNDTDRNEGILLCHPLPQEYMHCYWSLRELSELLSNAGFHVLRFDYFGTGDSTGESNEADTNQWKADILSAASELKNRYNVDQISLLGLRFGATLAFKAASNNEMHLNSLVLWDPVLNGKTHIKELEGIQNEIMIYTIPKFNKSLIARDYDELVGYPFPSQHRNSIKQIDLFGNSFPNAKRVVILTSEDKAEYRKLFGHLSSNALKVEYKVIKDFSRWGKLTSVLDAQFPSKILNEIVSSLMMGGSS